MGYPIGLVNVLINLSCFLVSFVLLFWNSLKSGNAIQAIKPSRLFLPFHWLIINSWSWKGLEGSFRTPVSSGNTPSRSQMQGLYHVVCRHNPVCSNARRWKVFDAGLWTFISHIFLSLSSARLVLVFTLNLPEGHLKVTLKQWSSIQGQFIFENLLMDCPWERCPNPTMVQETSICFWIWEK